MAGWNRLCAKKLNTSGNREAEASDSGHLRITFKPAALWYIVRQRGILFLMYTVIETPLCQRYADSIWDENERLEFISWLSENPFSGDVIPGTGGIRKARWSAPGKGKRGGVRGIYYNVLDNGEIYLLIVYTKAEFDNISNKTLIKMKEAMKDG